MLVSSSCTLSLSTATATTPLMPDAWYTGFKHSPLSLLSAQLADPMEPEAPDVGLQNARAGHLVQLTFLRMGDLMFDNWDAFTQFLHRLHTP